MPNTDGCEDRQLEAMSDEQLRQILREDASKTEGEDTDMERILHIMEVLAKRSAARGEGKSAEEAMESFNRDYCTDHAHSLISESETQPPKRPAVILWRRVAVLAAALTLLLSSVVTVNAWSFGLWDIIAKWTHETFHFGYWSQETEPVAPATADITVYAGLQDALNRLKIDASIIPTWMPEGYTEKMIEIQETPLLRIVFASYQNGSSEILVQITDHLTTDPLQVEQSGNLLEVYAPYDIQYYIFENNRMLQTAWVAGSLECSITSVLSPDEIKLMIDSIKRG